LSSRSPIESRSQNDLVAAHFRRSCEALSRAADDANLRAMIHVIAETITAAFRAGHKLLIAGNGGSAADAQHIAGEFLSRLNFDRNPLPAIALTTDSSVLTAIGNDYGFERTFATAWRDSARMDGFSVCFSAISQHSAVSTPSAGRSTRRCGIARRAARCSMG